MSKFYLTDPNLNTLPLTDLQFRIYQYCCANYNVKKQQAFIRIVNIGGQFQLTKDEVQEQLIELSKIKHLDLPLIQIKEGRYISFDMPAHLKQIHTKELKIDYLYPRLDQYELYDQLEDLPTEELKKIDPKRLKYSWVLKNVIKNRA